MGDAKSNHEKPLLVSSEAASIGLDNNRISISGQQWRYRLSDKASKADLLALSQALETQYGYISSIAQALSQCLLGRDIGPSQLDNFLRPSLKNLFPDPLSFLDMERAVEAMISALLAKKIFWFLLIMMSMGPHLARY